MQNSDGGFGESCGSYDDPELKGRGPSTASQTAWGLIGLMAAGDLNEPAVKQAVGYLLGAAARQRRMDRSGFHRHWISASLLSEVSPLSECLPALCSGALSEFAGRGAGAGSHALFTEGFSSAPLIHDRIAAFSPARGEPSHFEAWPRAQTQTRCFHSLPAQTDSLEVTSPAS